MPDYDLGTAHGRIVIDSDNRGGDAAAKNLAAIRAQAIALQSALKSVNLDTISRGARQVTDTVRSAAGQLRTLTQGLSQVAPMARNAYSDIASLTQEVANLGTSAIRTSNQVAALHGALESLTSVRGAIGALTGAFSDFDERLAGMPLAARKIVEVNRNIRNLALSGGLLRKAVIAIGSTTVATAALAAVGPRIAAVSRGLRLVAGTAALISPRIASAGVAVRRLGTMLGVAGAEMGRFALGIQRGIRGAAQMVSGFMLMQKGLSGIGRMAKIALISISALGAAAAGVQFLGTAILGTLNAVKQLSGALLILPGVAMSLGIAGGVAAVALKNLGGALKAAALEGDEFEKAIAKMSPTMQGAAREAQKFWKDITGLGNIAADTTFAGIKDDIKLLGEMYMPVLQRGVGGVARGLNTVKNGFRDFLAQPATVEDLNEAFALTEHTVRNLGKAVWPFMAGLRDLGMVGMEAFRDMTNGAGDAAKRFGDFMSEARKTGQLREWIDNGVQGFKDLGNAIMAFGRGFKAIFEEFGSSGDDALSRLVATAEKFQAAMERSADGGALETIAANLKRMGEVSTDAIVAGFEQLMGVLEKLAPFAADVSEAFGPALQTAFKVVGGAAQVLASALDAIPGAGAAVGILLGVGVALKGILLVATPVIRSIQTMAGAFLMLRGATNTVTGLGAAMSTAAGRVALLQTAMGRLRTMMAGGTGITIAIMAAMGAMQVMNSASQENAEGYSLMADAAKRAETSTKGFATAMLAANGAIEGGVVSEAAKQFEDLAASTQALADKAPGTAQSLADLRIKAVDFGSVEIFHTKQFEQLKNASEQAQLASLGFDKLGWASKDVGAALTGTEDAWNNLHNNLAKLGPEGEAAINALYPVRQGFVDTKAAMDKMGETGVTVANAINTIADAGSSASDKLNALKMALQAMGLMETTAQEQAFQFAQQIREIGDAATSAADGSHELGLGLLDANNQLKPGMVNAQNLHRELGTLRDGFLTGAVAGRDAGVMWGEMQPALQRLADAFQLPLPVIQEIISKMGAVPSVVTTLMSVQGKDDVIQSLTELALKGQEASGKPITISVDSQAAVDKINELGAKVTVWDQKTHTATLTIDPAKAQEVYAGLQALLKQPLPPPPVQAPQSPPVEPPPAGEQPPLPAPKVETPETPNPIPPPNPEPIPAPPVETPVVPPVEPPPPLPPLTVEVQGVDAAIGGITSVRDAAQGLIDKVNEMAQAAEGAMGRVGAAAASMATAAKGALEGLGAAAQSSGASLGQGFADGISSKVDAVRAAAMQLAEAASEPLPRSPAKIGPFSGKGWTPFRGASLAEGFAEGIASGAPLARLSALDMAIQVSKALDTLRAGMGMPTANLEANRAVGPGGKMYVRDPEVTQEELATNRAEKEKAKKEKAAEDERFKAYREQKEAEQKASNEAKADAKRTSKGNSKVVGSMQDLADKFDLVITSNQRDEPGSFHNDGSAYDFSGSAENMAALNRYLAENDPGATELFYDPGVNIDEGKEIGAIGGHSDHLHYVPSKREYNTAQETQETIASNTSSSNSVLDEIVAAGKAQGLSDEDIAAGVAAGLVESDLQDLPDIPGSEGDSEGALQQRPSMGWGPASEDVFTDATQFFEKYKNTDPALSPGQRAQAVQRSAYPGKYDERMAEAQALTADALDRVGRDGSSTARSSGTTAKTAYELKNEAEEQRKAVEILDRHIETGNEKLDESIRVAQNPGASDADVIRALQDIDDEIATTPNEDMYQELKELREATMEDRGLKEYDPTEGASTDVLGDSIKIVQGVFSILEGIEQGVQGVTDLASLLARGFENTKDVEKAIDSVQSIVSTFAGIASTVGDIVSTVASLAAIAAIAIPGIGQVAAGIGMVTQGIGTANAIVDLIQQGFKIAGRIAGGFLSALAGGKDGPLYGNVRTLLDTNDMTIKRWSDANPDDKRSSSYDLFGRNQGGNTTSTRTELNFYQGPGVDPYRMMDDAMFAVRAQNAGAYAG